MFLCGRFSNNITLVHICLLNLAPCAVSMDLNSAGKACSDFEDFPMAGPFNCSLLTINEAKAAFYCLFRACCKSAAYVSIFLLHKSVVLNPIFSRRSFSQMDSSLFSYYMFVRKIELGCFQPLSLFPHACSVSFLCSSLGREATQRSNVGYGDMAGNRGKEKKKSKL